MKIKDMSGVGPLSDIIFLHPETKERCRWVSQWNAGVWCRKIDDPKPTAIYPIFVSSLDETLEWEVVA